MELFDFIVDYLSSFYQEAKRGITLFHHVIQVHEATQDTYGCPLFLYFIF